MKKVLIVICVLSLLGLLAVPLLAEAFAEPDSVSEPAPSPGIRRPARGEEPVQVAGKGRPPGGVF